MTLARLALGCAGTLAMTFSALAMEETVASVVQIVGSPAVSSPDGAAVGSDASVSLDGLRVATGAGDRVAMKIMGEEGQPPAWLLVGEDTEIVFAAAEDAEADAGIEATIAAGAVRAVSGHADARYPCAFRTDSRSIHLEDNADAILLVDASGDSGTYALRSGRMEIRSGERVAALKSGMTRRVEDGRMRAARRFDTAAWEEMLGAVAIEGVEIPIVAAATRSVAANTRRVTPVTPVTPAAKPTPPAASEQNLNPAVEDAVYVRMVTSKGPIVLELDRGRAPISVANFVSYVEKKHYDGTVFHRVISNFMVQGGGFDSDLVQKKTDPPIKNEWRNGLKNFRGTIAMARTSAPDSATSQFYINVVDNAPLDVARGGAAYCVFGRVVAGMETVDTIRFLPTEPRGPHQNCPQETVLIESARVITKDEALR